MPLKSVLVWSFSKSHQCHPKNVKLMPVYSYSYSPSKSVFTSEMKYTASQFALIHVWNQTVYIRQLQRHPPPVRLYHIREFKQQRRLYFITFNPILLSGNLLMNFPSRIYTIHFAIYNTPVGRFLFQNSSLK